MAWSRQTCFSFGGSAYAGPDPRLRPKGLWLEVPLLRHFGGRWFGVVAMVLWRFVFLQTRYGFFVVRPCYLLEMLLWWICLVCAWCVLFFGLLVEAALALMVGTALVDAMWCAMVLPNEVGLSPIGVVPLVIGGVVSSGLGFRWAGLPFFVFVRLLLPALQGCSLALTMPTGYLEVGFVVYRL